MGRIRTIKPEFPQSESVGSLSRDARLLFIQIWTVVDDAGRCRATPQVLAGQLYPYDDDAPRLIETWLAELEAGGQIRRYLVSGNTYLHVVKWGEHQKIDRPSKSRLPSPPEASTNAREPSTSPREPSMLDLGPRTLDLGPGTLDQPSSSTADAADAASEDPFEEFWKAYPRREGPNPRKPAEEKFAKLVKAGLDPAMLIAEVKKFHETESTRGNVGTRYIPQAITWLNQQRWFDHAAVQMLVATASPEEQIESAVRMYAKNGFWSRHAGPEPGLSGCRASPELLAKHGIAPDGRKLAAMNTGSETAGSAGEKREPSNCAIEGEGGAQVQIRSECVAKPETVSSGFAAPEFEMGRP